MRHPFLGSFRGESEEKSHESWGSTILSRMGPATSSGPWRQLLQRGLQLAKGQMMSDAKLGSGCASSVLKAGTPRMRLFQW